MRYYKVVDQLNTSVTIDTIKSNYSLLLPNAAFHRNLIEIITNSSAKNNIPINVYWIMNNTYYLEGVDYFKKIKVDQNGMVSISSFIYDPKITALNLMCNKQEILGFFNDIQANGVYEMQEGYYVWEYIFEKIRSSLNPNLPRRAESFFLFDNQKDCEYYRDNIKGFGTICEVEIIEKRKLCRFDMNLLNNIPDHYTYAQAAAEATNYWSGKVSKNPLYEIVFQGTCKLLPL